jgi:hypothetical protein
VFRPCFIRGSRGATLRANAAKWPGAKKARTSSAFLTLTPHRANSTNGPQWQNSREKPHVFGFWPTLWPDGYAFRASLPTPPERPTAGIPLHAKEANWRSAKLARTSSVFLHRHPTPPANRVGGEGSISREKCKVLTFWRVIWRSGFLGAKKAVEHPNELRCACEFYTPCHPYGGSLALGGNHA